VALKARKAPCGAHLPDPKLASRVLVLVAQAFVGRNAAKFAVGKRGCRSHDEVSRPVVTWIVTPADPVKTAVLGLKRRLDCRLLGVVEGLEIFEA